MQFHCRADLGFSFSCFLTPQSFRVRLIFSPFRLFPLFRQQKKEKEKTWPHVYYTTNSKSALSLKRLSDSYRRPMPEDKRYAYDFILSGEFSEQTGPVVSDLCRCHKRGAVHSNDLFDEDTKEFMMRAMSGDHVYNNNNRSHEPEQIQFRPCEITMNRVKWRYRRSQPRDMLMAFVCSFQICDVFARAYTRTVCFAYLTPDTHKLFAVLPWVSHELNSIARHLFDVTRKIHELEVFEAYLSLEYCIAHKDHLTQLSDRHKLQLAGEFEDTKARLRQLRPPGGATSVEVGQAIKRGLGALNAGEQHVQSVVEELSREYTLTITDETAVNIVNRLTTQKGSATLRTIPTLFGSYEYHFGDYADIAELIERAISILSQPTETLMDGLAETMQSMPALMSKGFKDIFNFHPPSHFRLRIGSFIAGDPHVDRWREVAEGIGGDIPRDENLTPFEAEDLFDRLLLFGEHAVVNIAFHALKGTPIIVCGNNVTRVLDAMRLAAMFVPGLAQSRFNYQIGFIPFDDTSRVTADDIIQNSIIGCPPRAILDDGGVPYLGDVVVWVIGSRKEAKEGGSGNKQHAADSVVESTLYGTTYRALEAGGAGSVLEDLFALTRIGAMGHEEQQPMSDYVKLTLSRIFVDLMTMASLVLYSLKESGDGTFVLSETMVFEILVTQFGYQQVRNDDCAMVCNICKRILLLTHQSQF